MEFLYSALVTSLATSLVLAGVYVYLFMVYRHQFLMVWALSWCFYATRFIIQLVDLALYQMFWTEIAIQSSALISGVLLLWGLRLFEQRSISWVWNGISIFLLLWVVTEPLWAISSKLYSLPIFLFLSVVNFAMGMTYYRLHEEVGIAAKFTGVIFILWGLHKLNYPLFAKSPAIAPWGFLLASIFALCASLGMLLIYFEKNRRALNESEARLQFALECANSEISANQLADAILQRAKKDWERTFDAVPDLIAILDADSRVQRVNLSLADRLGAKPSDLIGRNCHEVLDGRDAPHVDCPHSRLLADGIKHCQEMHLPKFGGWFEITAVPLHDDGGQLVGCVHVAHDITERTLTNQKREEYQHRLKELARSQYISQEHERHRLATFLHDQIGQDLALIRIKLGIMCGGLEAQPLASSAKELWNMLGDIIDTTRSLTIEISPPALYQIGLGAAIETLADLFRKRHGLELTSRGNYDVSIINEETKIVVYQAIRELVVNVVKHAKVNKADISFEQRGDRLAITVSDEGCGFSEVQKQTGNSFGLFNIREQVTMVGGDIEIVTKIGLGTSVTVEVPIAS